MEPFTVVSGTAAPLLRDNINTDAIIRIERLMAFPKGQLGPYCFESWRYRPDGSEDPEFVLNQAAFRSAVVLLVGRNFGCGSSREQAVWALADLGYRCVIAASFGDIFYNNCFQNGLLPVALPADAIDEMSSEARHGRNAFVVDLERQQVVAPSGRTFAFEIDPTRRQALLEGLDELGMTLRRSAAIDKFQERDRSQRPWIYEI